MKSRRKMWCNENIEIMWDIIENDTPYDKSVRDGKIIRWCTQY